MKKKNEIEKMEKLIIENFAKVYNRIKPINENEVNEHGTIGYYIAKALTVEPTSDENGIYYNVSDENAGDDYGLIFDVYVEPEKGEGLYGKRIMYFREDSVFNNDLYGESSELAKDLFDLANGEVKMKFQGNFKYTRYTTYWGEDDIDMTNELSQGTIEKLTELFDKLANNSFEAFEDSNDDGNMSDSEFARWSNPSMFRR